MCYGQPAFGGPKYAVLLVEAGSKDKGPLIHMPAGVGVLLSRKTKFNWWFYTEGQQHLDGRKLYWPRGKGLGGSSSINGMVYIRGHARDYDQWRQLGLDGWSYADVLPYFKRAETHEKGGNDFHGDRGPLRVSGPKSGAPLFRTFIEAGKEAGHPHSEDFNGYAQEGVGAYDLNIHEGKRWSAARGYLTPILDRPNLTVEVGALSSKILFEGQKAVGLEYLKKSGRSFAWTDREVILCGGAVNSPQLLQLSGIGDADHLKKFGIESVVDLKGVGQNLQDHLDCTVQYECTKPVTLFSETSFFKSMRTGMQFMFFGTGAGTGNGLESGGFVKTRPDLEVPDVQLHLVNALMTDHGRVKADRHGFTVHICQLRPESRGFIGLRSANPYDHPLIQPNYLDKENDRITMREGVKIAREIIGQEAFDVYRGPEMMPGSDIRSDGQIDAWIRRNAETIYHPVGTCKMGNDDMAVVDGSLKVHGCEGLRVVDASVMPTLVGGNTNAPTIMIAEKAADMILGHAAPASEHVAVKEDADLAKTG